MSITDFPVKKAAREIAKISLSHCVSYHGRKDINDLAKKIEEYLIQEIISTRRLTRSRF